MALMTARFETVSANLMASFVCMISPWELTFTGYYGCGAGWDTWENGSGTTGTSEKVSAVRTCLRSKDHKANCQINSSAAEAASGVVYVGPKGPTPSLLVSVTTLARGLWVPELSELRQVSFVAGRKSGGGGLVASAGLRLGGVRRKASDGGLRRFCRRVRRR